jgi:hypothetical protein
MALSIDDFCNPTFDIRKPVIKIVIRNGRNVKAIEGEIYTDNYRHVGYTYFLRGGFLHVNYWYGKKNVRLIETQIKTIEEFEKSVKQADKKISRYFR